MLDAGGSIGFHAPHDIHVGGRVLPHASGHPRCRKFKKVQVFNMHFRIASADRKFKTCQCYFRVFSNETTNKGRIYTR